MPLPGDRIVYRHDETGELVTATVIEVVNDDGWLEVRDEPWEGAVEGDTPWIAPDSVEQNLTLEAERLLRELTLEEKLVASIAVVNYRKQQKEVA